MSECEPYNIDREREDDKEDVEERQARWEAEEREEPENE